MNKLFIRKISLIFAVNRNVLAHWNIKCFNQPWLFGVYIYVKVFVIGV